MRIPAITDLHIKQFSGGGIIKMSSYAKNAVYDKYPDSGNWYATQRPGINVFEDASAAVSDAKGRGVYYWNKVGKKYFVNNATVYQTSYSGSTMSITAGTERVYIFELGNYLIILDPENNEGWVINSSSPTVIAAISDADFPPNAGKTLAKGGAVINSKLFVGDTLGNINESSVSDPTAWNALSVRNAEVQPDGGVYIGEHHQHVVALGNRTLEFFYDDANPTGSSLSPRTDIDFSVGAVNLHSFWEEADLTFWVGNTASGGVSVYSLQNFIPTKISTNNIDTFLGSAITIDSVLLNGSGFQVGGRTYYVLTLYFLSTTIAPTVTLVYELTSDRWYLWGLEQSGIDDFPVMNWTKATSTRLGEGILSNGDLITPADDNSPQDTIGASTVFETGVFEDGVFSSTGFSGANINMQLVTGPQDFGNRKRKFQSEIWPVGTPTDTSTTLSIEVSDESDDTWQAARSVDVGGSDDRLRRCGKFRQRNYRLTYADSEQYRIEGLETIERQGTA
ncbi:MAG: hypothetical protein BMS9Abin36_2086 [Gammaproteobacteria bacterium]|nr:MAG: hypothetical protein BMS9Abin36_2086 [Gammaproteobacteria bacterium]